MKLANIKVAIGQNSPEWLNREATLQKVISTVKEAADQGCQLIAFSETHLPGYPFWLEPAHGARFDNEVLKTWHAHYLDQAVVIENGDLSKLQDCCRENGTAVYLGILERPHDRGGHSVYASMVYIDQTGVIGSVQRKLMPTYEERLCWSIGDGNGLVTHDLEGFKVGALNCWENWMPLARTALHAQGENLHVASWPGSVRNTKDITRFMAMEGRSFVVSASCILLRSSISKDLPYYHEMVKNMPEVLADGGSCIAAPNGEWIIPPVAHKEGLLIAELNLEQVFKERQNFDPSGHYSRPDVFELTVNRKRQSILTNQ